MLPQSNSTNHQLNPLQNPNQHLLPNFKSLLQDAYHALEKLNNLCIKNTDMTSMLLSFDNDLVRKFNFHLNQSHRVHQKSMKSIYKKQRKAAIEKMVTKHCKLRSIKKQEKTLIKEQLLSVESSKSNDLLMIEDETPLNKDQSPIIDGDGPIPEDSGTATSDHNSSKWNDKNVPLSIRSKRISKQPPVTSGLLSRLKVCYVCKKRYNELHHFYDRLCPSCADFNYKKRTQKCDFSGRIALVTGCRVKIGYEIALYLLRNNCKVIGTTRFPKDAFERFSKEKDFDSFKHNLVIYPLNLRNLSVLDQFIKHLYATYPKLDILINNAAQTIRRAPVYYQNLLAIESKPLEEFNNPSIYQILPQDFGTLNCIGSDGVKLQLQNDEMSTEITVEKNIAENLSESVLESLVPLTSSDYNSNMNDFPLGVVDKDNQQVDLSAKTSWNKTIEDIDFIEFAETQVVNAWAPWQLNSKLKDLMLKSENNYKFIINVSSMEGKFARFKHSTHPHTNMSKASLNMMTRTCGSHYAKFNILMNSVDTGWVSEMSPSLLLSEQRTVPLDEVDGAMRVLDPIIQAINNNEIVHSTFLKDYKPTEW